MPPKKSKSKVKDFLKEYLLALRAVELVNGQPEKHKC
jgi:hypothetical protein